MDIGIINLFKTGTTTVTTGILNNHLSIEIKENLMAFIVGHMVYVVTQVINVIE